MRQALDGGLISGDGPFTRRCHAIIEQITGSPKALLTTSCTHALEMAALLLDIEPGDEVICPAFTFVSTINAFVLRGARPVFVDIRPDTLNLDESLLEQAITREDQSDPRRPLRGRRLRHGGDLHVARQRATSRSSRTTRMAFSGSTTDDRWAR